MKFEKRISFCMMIKDEEKNLPRCLDSIKPVLDEGLAELIIVDTGSSDRSIAIAKEYTDRVYEHPWNNNFSDMRNVSISYAKGEWIWIIDADEEVQNPETIINLFNHDISKYNTICVKFKNYMKNFQPGEREQQYNVCSLVRGFRNTLKFKFEGAVHNQPLFEVPIFYCDTIFRHYGYIFEDKSFRKKKFDRTTKILYTELDKDPNNIYYQFQLAASWFNMDKSRALTEVRKAYKLVTALPENQKQSYLYVYLLHARIAFSEKSYSEVLEICTEGLKLNADLIDLWFIVGMTQTIVKNYDESIFYFSKFFSVREEFYTLPVSNHPSLSFYHLDENSLQTALNSMAIAYFEKSEYGSALEYVEKLDTSDFKSNMVIKLAIKTCNYKLITDYLHQIQNNKDIEYKFISILESQKVQDEQRNEIRSFIIDYLDKTDRIDNPYYILNVIRSNMDTNRAPDKVLLEKIAALNSNKMQEFYGDIVWYLIQHNVKPHTIAAIGTSETLSRYISYTITINDDKYSSLLNYLNINSNIDDIEANRFWIILARHVLFIDKINDHEYMKIFELFVSKGISYINHIYNKKIIEAEMINHMKNDEHRFFMYMAKAMQFKNKSQKVYIDYLKSALKVFPMVRGIKELLNRTEDVSEENAKEMEKLKNSFKYRIRELIEQVNIEEVEILVRHYEELVPNDMEMLLLKSEIALLKL